MACSSSATEKPAECPLSTNAVSVLFVEGFEGRNIQIIKNPCGDCGGVLFFIAKACQLAKGLASCSGGGWSGGLLRGSVKATERRTAFKQLEGEGWAKRIHKGEGTLTCMHGPCIHSCSLVAKLCSSCRPL